MWIHCRKLEKRYDNARLRTIEQFDWNGIVLHGAQGAVSLKTRLFNVTVAS